MGSNWIWELSCRKRALGVPLAGALLDADFGTAGDRDADLRVDFDILKGESFTRGLLNGRFISSVLVSDS